MRQGESAYNIDITSDIPLLQAVEAIMGGLNRKQELMLKVYEDARRQRERDELYLNGILDSVVHLITFLNSADPKTKYKLLGEHATTPVMESEYEQGR